MTSSDSSSVFSISDKNIRSFEDSDLISEPEASSNDDIFDVDMVHVDKSLLKAFGTLYASVQNSLVISPFPDVPKVSPKTPLYLNDGSFIGHIKEPFGPVSSPFYLVALSKTNCHRVITDKDEFFWLADNSNILPDPRFLVSSSEGESSEDTDP